MTYPERGASGEVGGDRHFLPAGTEEELRLLIISAPGGGYGLLNRALKDGTFQCRTDNITGNLMPPYIGAEAYILESPFSEENDISPSGKVVFEGLHRGQEGKEEVRASLVYRNETDPFELDYSWLYLFPQTCAAALYRFEDKVTIPPSNFHIDFAQAAGQFLRDKYEPVLGTDTAEARMRSRTSDSMIVPPDAQKVSPPPGERFSYFLRRYTWRRQDGAIPLTEEQMETLAPSPDKPQVIVGEPRIDYLRSTSFSNLPDNQRGPAQFRDITLVGGLPLTLEGDRFRQVDAVGGTIRSSQPYAGYILTGAAHRLSVEIDPQGREAEIDLDALLRDVSVRVSREVDDQDLAQIVTYGEDMSKRLLKPIASLVLDFGQTVETYGPVPGNDGQYLAAAYQQPPGEVVQQAIRESLVNKLAHS